MSAVSAPVVEKQGGLKMDKILGGIHGRRRKHRVRTASIPNAEADVALFFVGRTAYACSFGYANK